MLKKKLVIFAVIILFVFGFLTYQSIRGEGRFIDFPLYPLRILEKGTSSVIRSVEKFFNTYILIVGKEEENRELRQKISELQQDKNRHVEIELENDRLRKILKLMSEKPSYVTAARVFARDPTNWFKILWINKGSDDGIAKDMVAVSPAGPVGKIHRVLNNGANIIMITDVNSSVAVRMQSSRIEGILVGRGGNSCYLKYVSKETEVNVGDRIITSGLDGIYPEGLFIAYVSKVIKEGEDMFQLIEAVPAQDLNAVEEVAILKR
jgi:rod shape-determining protein MreC